MFVCIIVIDIMMIYDVVICVHQIHNINMLTLYDMNCIIQPNKDNSPVYQYALVVLPSMIHYWQIYLQSKSTIEKKRPLFELVVWKRHQLICILPIKRLLQRAVLPVVGAIIHHREQIKWHSQSYLLSLASIWRSPDEQDHHQPTAIPINKVRLLYYI